MLIRALFVIPLRVLVRCVVAEYANRDAIMEAKKAKTGSYH